MIAILIDLYGFKKEIEVADDVLDINVPTFESMSIAPKKDVKISRHFRMTVSDGQIGVFKELP